MISKYIHYCWFGYGEKPKAVLECIESWKKYLPDYEIIEWNENNFDVNCHPYCAEAYKKRKWAFVTDYARLYIVYNNGGIYFDTDVEVVKSFDDITKQEFFLGMEDGGRINTGVGFGAKKHSLVVKAMLDEYQNLHYIDGEGDENKTVCPVYNTRAIEKLGCTLMNQNVEWMGGTIYTSEYFSPIHLHTRLLHTTKNTHSIHHFANSWLTPRERIRKNFRLKLSFYVIQPLKKLLNIKGGE